MAVEAVTDVGVVGRPSTVKNRDGGASALVGGQHLWTFGDTIFNTAGADGRWLRTNSGGWAPASDPANPIGGVDAAGTPVQFIPHTPEEVLWEQANPGSRVALWPGTVLPRDDGTALVVYTKLYVPPGSGFDWENVGTGLAIVEPGDPTATRLPGLLFDVTAGDLPFNNGFVDVDGYVYLYYKNSYSGAYLARAPEAQVADRGAWEFATGNVASPWSPTMTDATTVATDVGSVSWSAYLGKYLSVGNRFVSNSVVMRTADAPEGPWSSPTVAFVARPVEEQAGLGGGFPINYAGREHVSQAELEGRRIVVTYAHKDGPGAALSLRRVLVTLG